MKTKIVVLGLTVLAITFSTRGFAAIVYFDTTDPLVLPGETISISIFSTVETDSIRMDRISDGDFGVVSNLWLNPNYNSPLEAGVIVNAGGILIEGVSSSMLPDFPAVSGVLYSFDYLVPQASAGHSITIFADSSQGIINQVWVDIGPGLDPVTPDSLTLTIVPEPTTILLLGIGGLVLAKTNRQRKVCKH